MLDHEQRLNLAINFVKTVDYVKSFSLEEQMLRKYEKEQLSLSRKDLKSTFMNSVISDFQSSLVQFIMFGSLLISSGSVIQNEISIGVLISCMLVSTRTIQPLLSLCVQYIKHSEIELIREKIYEIANLESLQAKKMIDLDKLKGGLEVVNLSYTYGKSYMESTLGLNIRFNDRDFIAVTGKNIYETTVFAELLCGIRKPNIGQVLIDGNDVEIFDREIFSNKIEYLPIKPSIFKGTILDNISRFNLENRLTSKQIAVMLELHIWVNKFNMGYDTILDPSSKNMISSSFLQLLSLARALSSNPKILVIDRLDSVLDLESKSVYLQALSQFKHQFTMIVITEDDKIIKIADKVYNFDQKLFL